MAAFKNIALWGVGGDDLGAHIVDALIKDGSFNLTIVARASSKSTYPASLRVVRVDDDMNHASLLAALRGQDALVSAVGHYGIAGQLAVAKAAMEAGVRRFLPSEYGFDNADPRNAELSPILRPKYELAAELATLAATASPESFAWTGIATGLWLDWALDGAAVDIDPHRRTVAYWDGGAQAPSMSTLAYAAEAVRQVLRHPELFANQRVFSEAFAASQKDVVAELERQQGATYESTAVDGKAKVQWTKDVLAAGWDTDAAMTTVKAELWMGEFKADFVKAGKKPILEEFIEMPKITLHEVVKNWVAAQKA